MRSKYNTRQRKKSIQGLRSFKDSLPKNIREKILKKAVSLYEKIRETSQQRNPFAEFQRIRNLKKETVTVQ